MAAEQQCNHIYMSWSGTEGPLTWQADWDEGGQPPLSCNLLSWLQHDCSLGKGSSLVHNAGRYKQQAQLNMQTLHEKLFLAIPQIRENSC